MLRPELERRVEIGLEVGRALAGDAVDEVEREVVEARVAKGVERAPHVVRAGTPLQHGEQLRLEALGAERDARDAASRSAARERGRDRLGIRLHRHLVGGR